MSLIFIPTLTVPQSHMSTFEWQLLHLYRKVHLSRVSVNKRRADVASGVEVMNVLTD
jgi:hypothetical protein